MRILLLPLLLISLSPSVPLTSAFLPPLPHHAPLGHAATSRLLHSARPQPRDGATILLAAAREGDGRWDAAGSANKGRIRVLPRGGGGGAVGRAGRSGALGLVTEEGQGGGEVAVKEGGAGGLQAEERADVRFEGFGRRADVAGAKAGEGFESAPFEAGGGRWQVVVYPAGQSKAEAGQADNFAVQLFGPTHRRKGRLGVYLRFLPDTESAYSDTAFSLIIKGQQQTGPRFDVAFDCGMRFCHPSRTDSSLGMTDDWGAHILPKEALPDFCDQETGDLTVQVDLKVFASSRAPAPPPSPAAGEAQARSGADALSMAPGEDGEDGGQEEALTSRIGSRVLSMATPGLSDEARRLNGVFWSWPSDIRNDIQLGQVFIPTISPGTKDFEKKREDMFNYGVYPGVEYRVMGLEDGNGAPIFTTRGSAASAVLKVRPIYPVTKALERQDWPVTVPLPIVPTALSQAMYNTATLCGTVLVCAAFLTTGLLGREFVSLYKIPSRSMEPFINSGDLVVAEKFSAKVGRASKRGEVIMFEPPAELRAVVEKAGGRLGGRDLFVKRVAAVPGDKVSVRGETAVVNGQTYSSPSAKCQVDQFELGGRSIAKMSQDFDGTVPEGATFVLGDCSPVSVDSRVWGPLDDGQVQARPILRLWPPERFGPL